MVWLSGGCKFEQGVGRVLVGALAGCSGYVGRECRPLGFFLWAWVGVAIAVGWWRSRFAGSWGRRSLPALGVASSLP